MPRDLRLPFPRADAVARAAEITTDDIEEAKAAAKRDGPPLLSKLLNAAPMRQTDA